MKKILLLFAAALGSVSSVLAQASPLGGGVSCPNGYGSSVLFSFTGTTETFTVPAGVTSLHITAIAPTGGDGAYNGTVGTSAAPGGYGGQVSGFLAVTPGDVLYITVGQRGQDAVAGGTMVANAFNGGGRGGPTGAGGSGATDIRRGGTSLTNRIMVAGGGGGAGANGCSGSAGSGYHPYGGRGGNANAAGFDGETSVYNGSAITGGTGGIVGGSAAPGVGCAGYPGSAGNINGNGGAGPSFNACITGGANGGGGGGGYIQGGGGGGGAIGTTGCSGNVTSGGGGGAGGSNYISSDFTSTNTTLTASTIGNVIICYPTPVIMPVVSNVTYAGTPCVGATTTLTASGSLGSASDWGWYYNGSFQSYGATFTFTVPNASSALIQVRGEGGTVGTSASFYDYTMAFYANPTVNVNPSSGTYCGDVTQVATGGTTYLWSNGSTSASNTVTAPSQTQSLTVTDANGCTTSATTNVIVSPAVFVAATFDSGTGVITAAASGGNGTYFYSWAFNGNPIVGANSATYMPTTNGVYAVTVADTNGICFSNSTVVVAGVGVDNINASTFTMSPNPTTGVLVLDNLTIGKNFRLINTLGQLIQSFEATSTQMALDITAQPAGTYFLQSEGQALSIVKQ